MSSNFSDSMFRAVLGNSGTCVPVAFTGTNAVWGSPTTLIPGVTYEFISSQNCHVEFNTASESAIATTSRRPSPAWTRTEVTRNQADFVGVIRNTDSGTLWITPQFEANYK